MDEETNQQTCSAGGRLGATCRLGCRAGYEMSGAADGVCQMTGNGTEAEYVGMDVDCAPLREANGECGRFPPIRSTFAKSSSSQGGRARVR